MKRMKGGAFLLESCQPEDVFTPEDLNEEQKLIAKTTDEFIREQVFPLLEQIEQQNFSHTVRLLQEAGELGLLAADVPEAYGGIGLDKVSSTLITEKMAQGRSFALSHGAHVGIGTLPIVFFGTEQQKKRYLPALANGKKLAAYALTEPGSGSDALGAKTTAVLQEDGKHYLLNGEKQWITNSAFADLFIVYAKVDGEKFSAFIVEKDFPGVSTGPEEHKMGIKGSSTRTLILQEAQVPAENLLGEVGKGHLIAFNILNMGRFKLAAGTVGTAKRVLELAIKYALERKQFKQPIASFPLIQEKIATMAIELYATESLVYRTAGVLDQGLSGVEQKQGQEVAKAIGEYAIECSIAKVVGSEMLDYVVDEAVQIHGGYGFMSEYEVETHYRDSRINRIFEGTNEINRLLIPAALIRKANKGELPFFARAQGLQSELMNLMPTLPDPQAAPLTLEQEQINHAKLLFLFVAGQAIERYGTKLTEQQEMIRDISDIALSIYTMESTLLRAAKQQNQSKPNATSHLQFAEALIYNRMQKLEQIARHTLTALFTGDTLRVQLAILRKLTRIEPKNELQLKRNIVKQLLKAKKYIVQSRS
ncbi:Acyl-CoA dehydrogenase [Seinonella peptonophila]|uniref:Acyl-CoA dehydrogenase n=1 Tax=Seinonella peptonophila TaxID=112248 RepID=A0A1M4Z3N5_9BACL|nr:acyl-CoA dehydrogenase family protein [Seinonella peptonophila]SHF12558.1 Acyl-CoA dehydrogenase [Seinonella peptonophila]